MLELLDIDGKKIDLITDLYWSQQDCANIDGTFSEWFTVERGLRQGLTCHQIILIDMPTGL